MDLKDILTKPGIEVVTGGGSEDAIADVILTTAQGLMQTNYITSMLAEAFAVSGAKDRESFDKGASMGIATTIHEIVVGRLQVSVAIDPEIKSAKNPDFS